MTYVIDIDDTILYSNKIKCPDCGRINYESFDIDKEEISNINRLYKEGNIIIFHTGRNWDCYNLTKKQLENINVNYHELVMGKPQGVYIDKDSYKSISDYERECNGRK